MVYDAPTPPLTEAVSKTGEKTEIPVSYSKTVPDNFTDGIEVVVAGRLDPSGNFQADKLMTRCESKYKAKLE